MRRPSLTKKIAESLTVCTAHLLQDVQRAGPDEREHLTRGARFIEDLIAYKRFEMSGDAGDDAD